MYFAPIGEFLASSSAQKIKQEDPKRNVDQGRLFQTERIFFAQTSPHSLSRILEFVDRPMMRALIGGKMFEGKCEFSLLLFRAGIFVGISDEWMFFDRNAKLDRLFLEQKCRIGLIFSRYPLRTRN